MGFKTQAPAFPSAHHGLLLLQETTELLQTQLRDARQELEQAAQRDRGDLAGLREECRALLQAKTDLQEQVPPPVSQPCSPSPV